MSGGFSYRVMYMEDKEDFAELFLHGTPTPSKDGPSKWNYGVQRPSYMLLEVKIPENDRGFGRRVEELWHGRIKWYRLQGVPLACTSMKYAVARLELPRGTFWAMRNGNNISKYNFAIFDASKREFHFRMNIRQTTNLLKLLGEDESELGLMIGEDLCKQNKKVLVNRLSAWSALKED